MTTDFRKIFAIYPSGVRPANVRKKAANMVDTQLAKIRQERVKPYDPLDTFSLRTGAEEKP